MFWILKDYISTIVIKTKCITGRSARQCEQLKTTFNYSAFSIKHREDMNLIMKV